jgi:hypothetical protein
VKEEAEPSTSTPCGMGVEGTGVCADAGTCCSQYFYCGTSVEYCGSTTFEADKKPEMEAVLEEKSESDCNEGSEEESKDEVLEDADVKEEADSSEASPCGMGVKGNGVCAEAGTCCSQYFYCGTSVEYCGSSTLEPSPPTTRKHSHSIKKSPIKAKVVKVVKQAKVARPAAKVTKIVKKPAAKVVVKKVEVKATGGLSKMASDCSILQNQARTNPVAFASALRARGYTKAANALRSSRSCTAFSRSSGLNRSAQEHVNIMARVFTHFLTHKDKLKRSHNRIVLDEQQNFEIRKVEWIYCREHCIRLR